MQIALTRVSDDDPRAQRDALQREQTELLERHEERWLADLGLLRSEGRWFRGFVEAVSLAPARLMETHAQLLEQAPVRALRLRNADDDALDLHAWYGEFNHFARYAAYDLDSGEYDPKKLPKTVALAPLLALPLVAAVESLDLSWQFDWRWPLDERPNELARALAEATELTSLRALSLSENPLRSSAAQLLAQASHLASLRVLDLSETELDDAGWEAIASAPTFARLRTLRVGNIGPGGARAIAQSTRLRGLRVLDLRGSGADGTEGGDAAARALADAPHRATLRDLRLVASDEGAQAIASARHLASLHTLELRGNVGRSGAAALASATHLASLRRLDISRCGEGDGDGIESEDAGAIAGARHLAGLRVLSLSSNAIGDDGASALARSAHLSSLETFDLSSNELGPEAARALSSSKHLGKLRTLCLRNNSVGDAGAHALAASSSLASLRDVDLSGNGVGTEGARALASSSRLSTIASLDLSTNSVGDEGARAFAEASGIGALTSLDPTYNGLTPVGATTLVSRLDDNDGVLERRSV